MPASPNPPPVAPDKDQLRYAHDALLRRTLAYVGGSLGAFLPFLDFILLCRQAGRVLLPFPLDFFFLAVGGLLTCGLTLATLVSFREVIYVERKAEFDPEATIKSLGPGSWVIRKWTGRFNDNPDSMWFDAGVVVAWTLVVILVFWLTGSVIFLPST